MKETRSRTLWSLEQWSTSDAYVVTTWTYWLHMYERTWDGLTAKQFLGSSMFEEGKLKSFVSL